jgi:hypothetical protein
MESTAHGDDFKEVNGRKRHIYNCTSQRKQKSTEIFSRPAPVKLAPTVVSGHQTRQYIAKTNIKSNLKRLNPPSEKRNII